MNAISTSCLIVGAGIAGLVTALSASPAQTTLVRKSPDGSTPLAQGGIAAAVDRQDSPDLHFQDTVRAGGGLNDQEAVRVLVNEAADGIKQLEAWGVRFDRTPSGESEGTPSDSYALSLEGGHSRRRVLHSGDRTGALVHRVLHELAVSTRSVTMLESLVLAGLLLSGDRCTGALFLDRPKGSFIPIFSSFTVLATGGASWIFARTTNAETSSGDGIAAAYRAGARLMDLEFVQFHPTALAIKDFPPLLLSEAIRGEGGKFRNAGGELFMQRYHPDGELATRDEVSRALVSEMKRTGASAVFLDLRALDEKLLKEKFPEMLSICSRCHLNPSRDLLPVAPAAHYWTGGIKTDLYGRTGVPGLYAIGETACTGVHGANRLASNGLLEGIVFGRRAGKEIRRLVGEVSSPELLTSSGTDQAGMEDSPIMDKKEGQSLHEIPGLDPLYLPRIRTLLWESAGIIRHEDSLRKGLEALNDIRRAEKSAQYFPSHALHEALKASNLLLLGTLLLESALLRKESRGGHFRSDFSSPSPEFLFHLIWERGKEVSREPINTAPCS